MKGLLHKNLLLKDWELDTAENADGTIVPVRRRVVIKKMVYKPALGEDLYPPIQYEEKEWDISKDLAQLVHNPKVSYCKGLILVNGRFYNHFSGYS